MQIPSLSHLRVSISRFLSVHTFPTVHPARLGCKCGVFTFSVSYPFTDSGNQSAGEIGFSRTCCTGNDDGHAVPDVFAGVLSGHGGWREAARSIGVHAELFRGLTVRLAAFLEQQHLLDFAHLCDFSCHVLYLWCCERYTDFAQQ